MNIFYTAHLSLVTLVNIAFSFHLSCYVQRCPHRSDQLRVGRRTSPWRRCNVNAYTPKHQPCLGQDRTYKLELNHYRLIYSFEIEEKDMRQSTYRNMCVGWKVSKQNSPMKLVKVLLVTPIIDVVRAVFFIEHRKSK